MKTSKPHHGANDQTDKRPADEAPGTVVPFRPRKLADIPASDPDPDGPAAA